MPPRLRICVSSNWKACSSSGVGCPSKEFQEKRPSWSICQPPLVPEENCTLPEINVPGSISSSSVTTGFPPAPQVPVQARTLPAQPPAEQQVLQAPEQAQRWARQSLYHNPAEESAHPYRSYAHHTRRPGSSEYHSNPHRRRPMRAPYPTALRLPYSCLHHTPYRILCKSRVRLTRKKPHLFATTNTRARPQNLVSNLL